MKQVLPVLVTLAMAFTCTTAHAAGANGEDVSVDSWIYDALFELSAAGDLPNTLLHSRPLSRGAIAHALGRYRAASVSLTDGQELIIRRLEEEFHEELAGSANGEHSVRLGIGPTARTDQFRHSIAHNRIGFDAIGSFSVSDVLTTRARVRFDSDGRRDSQFHGEYWKEKFTAWVEQATTVIRWKKLTAAFGREYWRWGPSPHDAMLVSDHSPPFDGLRLQYRARNWSYAFHATALDRTLVFAHDYPAGVGEEGLAERYLVAHRLNWRARSNLEIAASEVMVFGGFERPWQWNYLNPFLPYYWEQLNNDTNDNPLWNLEISWRAVDGLLVYGEWMIDDFQIDFESEPQQIGVLAGCLWTPSQFDGRLALNGEYQRINTFVYGQGQPWNRYFHHRDFEGEVVGIGSNLGTDADRITIIPLYHVGPFVDLTARLDYVRRGKNRMSDPQPSVVPKDVPFPSGVVECDLRIGTGAQIRWRGQVVADVMVGYYRMTDYAHIVNNDLDGLYFQFKLNALRWKTFGV